MIEGQTNTENTYRQTMLDSSSSLKDFSLDRKKYHRKYILGEHIEEKDTQASVMGTIVETLLLEPDRFDEKFYLSACAFSPTGLMLAFVEALYDYTKDATNEEGIVMREFKDISLDAYNKSGFKITYEAVIKKFVGSDAEIYYNEILKVRTNGLTVISAQDVATAEKIVEDLRINSITSSIINMNDIVTGASGSIVREVHNQLKVEGHSIGNLHFKSMIDKVVILHDKKLIEPYDLKCTWSVENFYEEYYLYRRAYIQAYVYDVAVREYRDTLFPDYEIAPLKFIVCDSTNYYSPLIYCLSQEDLKEAWEGFEHKGRVYPGVKEIVENLEWALDNNIWNISKENYERGGLVNLKR